jgi:hypothetical protein
MPTQMSGATLIQVGRSRLDDFERKFPREAKAFKPGWGRRKIFALLSDGLPYTIAQINSMFKRGRTKETKKLYHGDYACYAVRLMNDQLKEIGGKYELKVRGQHVQLKASEPSRRRGARRRIRRIAGSRAAKPFTVTAAESTIFDVRRDLDAKREILTRKEQSILRRRFFRGKDIGTCGICARAFPVSLLVAGHIKRRALCTKKEKRDFSNIMPVCKLGCDDLFERGYVTVQEGRIVANMRLIRTNAVDRYVRSLVGRKCAYWSRASAPYFETHDDAHSSK